MKFPVVRQESFNDCGAACLLMIIKYYKGEANLNYLSDILKTSKQGTTAYNIVKVARELGFKATGIKGELPNKKLPIIAHVITKNNYSHFVVVYKVNYKKGNVFFIDPATGYKKTKISEFDEIYTKKYIELIPEAPIPILSSDKSFLDFIKEIVKSKREDFKLIYMLSAVVTILSIACSFYIKLAIDNLSGNNLNLLLLVFSIITVIKIFSEFIRNQLLSYLDREISNVLIYKTVIKIIHLPYYYYVKRSPGEILEKIIDLETVKELIITFLVILLIDIPIVLFTLIILFSISNILAVISLTSTIIIVLTLLIFKKIFDPYLEKLKMLRGNFYSFVSEIVSKFKTTKGLNLENDIKLKFNKKYFDFIEEKIRLDKIVNSKTFIINLIQELTDVILIFIGLKMVLENKITLGLFLAFNMTYNYFNSPFMKLHNNLTLYKKGHIAYSKAASIVATDSKKKTLTKQSELNIFNFSYSYDDIRKNLLDITLTIKKGEKIFVTGESGSGKTTLFNVIKGNLKIKKGNVFLSEKDLAEYRPSKIIMIPPKGELLNGPILNNFSSENEFEGMIKFVKGNLIPEIQKNGINTIVEEGGSNFSAGELQRLVLAKALTKKFDILILDESLSNTDSKLEAIILKRILKKYKDKTIIYISHRMTNINLFQRFIKFEKGEIISDYKIK